MGRKQKKYHYIYKTTNLVNEKYYIGMHSTDNLNDGYVGSGKRLWYSIKKYGKESFKLEILEMLPDRSSLKEREKELVNEELLKDSMSMNIKIGGEGGFPWHDKKYSDYQKEKGKNFFKQMWEEGKWKQFDRTGFKHSEESKNKMRISIGDKQNGEKNSQYGTIWITNGIEQKKIKKYNKIPEGWYKGMLKRKL